MSIEIKHKYTIIRKRNSTENALEERKDAAVDIMMAMAQSEGFVCFTVKREREGNHNFNFIPFSSSYFLTQDSLRSILPHVKKFVEIVEKNLERYEKEEKEEKEESED